jgi:predicted GTPase
MSHVSLCACVRAWHTGFNVKETIDLAIRITREREHFIKTSALMKLLESAHTRHRPPSKNGKQLKIRYATQGTLTLSSSLPRSPLPSSLIVVCVSCVCVCAIAIE